MKRSGSSPALADHVGMGPAPPPVCRVASVAPSPFRYHWAGVKRRKTRRSLWGWIWGAIWASTLPTCPPHPFITTQGALGCGARGAIGEIIHNPPGAPGAHRIHLLPLPDGRMGLRAGLLIGWMADGYLAPKNPSRASVGRAATPGRSRCFQMRGLGTDRLVTAIPTVRAGSMGPNGGKAFRRGSAIPDG